MPREIKTVLLFSTTKSDMEGATHRLTELEIEARMAREQMHKSPSKATELEEYLEGLRNTVTFLQGRCLIVLLAWTLKTIRSYLVINYVSENYLNFGKSFHL